MENSNYAAFATLAATYGARVIGALLVGIIAFWVANFLKRVTQRGMIRAGIENTLAIFTGKVVKWALLVFFALGILGLFGVETTSFAAVIAASGLAIGLAFQGSLSNLAAGVMLMIFRPFKIDDAIQVAGESGNVAEIGLFMTKIDTSDLRRIMIPNSKVFGNVLENTSHHPKRRVDVSVGVDYDADTDEVRDTLLNAARKVTGALSDPAPKAVLQSLGESAVAWQVRVFCNNEDYWSVHEKLTEEVKRSLDDREIGMPFPQLSLNFKPGMELHAGAAKSAGGSDPGSPH